jgi:arsenate reductase (thioredoxin)
MNKSIKGRKRILVLCIGNSCRSQMAEGFFREYKKDWDIKSAGISPVGLNPLSVKVMAEKGIDISKQKSKSVENFTDQDFDYVITVCDNVKELCPLFPGKAKYIHWDIEDPSFVGGSYEFKLKKFRETGDKIEKNILDFLREVEY